MRWAITILFLISIGCVQPNDNALKKKNSGKTDQKKSVINERESPDDAAERYFAQYISQSAAAAYETADKCKASDQTGEFKDVTAVDDYFNSKTKEIRLGVNKKFSDAMTKALDDRKGKKPSEVEHVYRKVGDGFSRLLPKK